MEVKKDEVEEILGCCITEKDFSDALKYAKRKQDYLHRQENRPVIMEHWYLAMLTAEYVRNNAFSDFTMDLCRMLQNMEKEHQLKEHGAPTNNHILSISAS